MPPTKRGVRKFFTKPKKGFRTSGKNKCWRGMDPPQQLSHESPSETLENPFEGFNDELSSTDEMAQVAPPVKPKIRAVGLFEGIGTGYHILKRELGLDVEKYYASEIDKDAIRVQLHNFGDEIIQLGDVRNVTSEVLDNMGQIHLLIGGSPCSEYSLVNYRRKNFDPSGSGVLFFEYVRILRHFLEKSKGSGETTFYWLFENTCKMEQKTLEIINRTLGCKPVAVCASQFTPMKRKRYFWGNLVGMSSALKIPGPREVPSLKDILPSYKTVLVDTMPTLTGNKAAQRSGTKLPILYDGKEEYLSASDYERVFGFPPSYTDCGLSESARVKLIGKCWDVHTVRAILEPLREFFRVLK